MAVRFVVAPCFVGAPLVTLSTAKSAPIRSALMLGRG